MTAILGTRPVLDESNFDILYLDDNKIFKITF